MHTGQLQVQAGVGKAVLGGMIPDTHMHSRSTVHIYSLCACPFRLCVTHSYFLSKILFGRLLCYGAGPL